MNGAKAEPPPTTNKRPNKNKIIMIGNFIFDKTNQPEWLEQNDWNDEFVLD